ncbi:Ubiquinol-cytochrome c reductase iron-sulfur subunit [Aquicella siphonis]|uniref:Ubiquinol-cytochrome c reductase iron-sulfur subunit n=1 Tax=Aquicella siphonis TaxID=254247 RepID=A0A5E4PKK7_9COXI|nr:ubiquinol-cytochrome c reductase iron-sulfur subunit [Aquicella siphonis]VVC76792.1 Ubiquinol-cytochrome c reductase iron-sulfur subunit [Aquicella siphonis]
MKDVIDKNRRCFLRAATTAVGGIGLAAASVPFFSYWMPSADTEAAAAPMKIDISSLKPREQLTVPWRGMPIWVIYRDDEMLNSLDKLTDKLRDPLSEQDQQPAYCKNTNRSIKPQYFISIGICTHLGCVPTYRPDVASVSPDWLGGFYCPCHGSKYDLSGRVYQNVPAPLNLKIPRHMYVSDTEIMIGEDQDGVQGAISIS